MEHIHECLVTHAICVVSLKARRLIVLVVIMDVQRSVKMPSILQRPAPVTIVIRRFHLKRPQWITLSSWGPVKVVITTYPLIMCQYHQQHNVKIVMAPSTGPMCNGLITTWLVAHVPVVTMVDRQPVNRQPTYRRPQSVIPATIRTTGMRNLIIAISPRRAVVATQNPEIM